MTPLNAAAIEAHREVHSVEDDNVGVESVHPAECTVEAGTRAGVSSASTPKNETLIGMRQKQKGVLTAPIWTR